MPVSRHAGLSLLEVLITMSIGLMLLLVLSTLLVNLLGSRADERKQAQLGSMVDASLSLMAMELRRAGYWNSGSASGNPYGQLYIEQNGQCLRYAYDTPPGNHDNAQRYFAFRLKFDGAAADKNGHLQRLASNLAGWSCNAADARWSELSKLSIGKIEQLQFSRAAGPGQTAIEIQLQASARLSGGRPAQLHIRTGVALRNQPQVNVQ